MSVMSQRVLTNHSDPDDASLLPHNQHYVSSSLPSTESSYYNVRSLSSNSKIPYLSKSFLLVLLSILSLLLTTLLLYPIIFPSPIYISIQDTNGQVLVTTQLSSSSSLPVSLAKPSASASSSSSSPSSSSSTIAVSPTSPTSPTSPPSTSTNLLPVPPSSVQFTTIEPVSITPPFPVPKTWLEYRKPRMLAVSRHHGTTHDMLTLGGFLGFDVDTMSMEYWTEYEKDHRPSLKKFWKSGMITGICHAYDIIAVSDAIWDGRVFLEYNFCWKKVLLITTTRYDMYLREKNNDHQRSDWHNTLNNALAATNFHYPVVVANNGYEHFWMIHHGFKQPTSEQLVQQPTPPQPLIPIIRALGESVVPFDPTVPLDKNPPPCLYYSGNPAGRGLDEVYKIAKRSGFTFECEIFGLPYGGPTFIKKRNTAYIFMPYQVSVMKQADHARAGIVTIVPTPSFGFEISKKVTPWLDHYYYALVDIQNFDKISIDSPKIREYIDIHHEAFAPCTIEFNSWVELNDIVAKQLWKNKQKECDEYASYYLDIQLVLWHKLFEERFPHIPLPPYTEHQIETGKKKLDMDLSNKK